MKKLANLLFLFVLTACSSDGYIRCESISTTKGMSWIDSGPTTVYRIAKYTKASYTSYTPFSNDYLYNFKTFYGFFSSEITYKKSTGGNTTNISYEECVFPETIFLDADNEGRRIYNTFKFQKELGTFCNCEEIYYSESKTTVKVVEQIFKRIKGSGETELKNKNLISVYPSLENKSTDSVSIYDKSTDSYSYTDKPVIEKKFQNESIASYYYVGSELVEYIPYKK